MGGSQSRQERLREYVERETQVVSDAAEIGDYTYQTLFLLELLPKLFDAYDTNGDTWFQLPELHAFLTDYLQILLDHGPTLLNKHLFTNVAKIIDQIKKSHPQKHGLIAREWEVDQAKILTDFTDMVKRFQLHLEKDPMWLRLEAKKADELPLYDREYEQQFGAASVADIKAGLTSIEMKHQQRVFKNQQRKAAMSQRPGAGFSSPRNNSIIGNGRRGSIGNGLTSFAAARPTGMLSPRGGQPPRGVFSFGQDRAGAKRPSVTPAPRGSVDGGHVSTPFAGAMAGKRASLPNIMNPGLASMTNFARRGSVVGAGPGSPMSLGLQRLLQQYARPGAGMGGPQLDLGALKTRYSDMVSPKEGLLYRWLILLKAGEPSFVVDYGQVDAAHCVSRPAFLQTFRMVLESTNLSFARICRQLFNRSRCGPVISAYQRQVLEGKPGRRRRPVNKGKKSRRGSMDRRQQPSARRSVESLHARPQSREVFVMNDLNEEGEEDEDFDELILGPAPIRGNSLASPGNDRPTFDISVSLPAPTVESNYPSTPTDDSTSTPALPVPNIMGFHNEEDEDDDYNGNYTNSDDDDDSDHEVPVFAMGDTLPTPQAPTGGFMDDDNDDEDYEESD